MTKGPCPGCGQPAEVRSNRSRYCRACYNIRYKNYVPCSSCSGVMRQGAKRCSGCVAAAAGSLREMSPGEIGWVAGVIEGEGTFASRSALSICVTMTDPDVIGRLAVTTGIGTVYHNMKRQQSHHKAPSAWYVRRRRHVEGLIPLIYPWLGARRRAAADQLLAAYGARDLRSVERAGLEPALPA